MTYDGLDRLTAANGFWGSVNIAYDTLGNITNYNFSDKGTTAYSYDAANRLTTVSGGVSRSFTYDGRGNVTANGKNTFSYNAANRMASSNVATYLYDGHGRRVKNTGANGDNYSFYDKAGRLIYREKHDGTKVNYVFLAKLQVARIEDNAGTKTTKYIHTDLLGSPVVETDSSGSVLESTRMHYRPFGQTKEAPKDEVGYTGHKFDTDIGLVYAQQRYYDSEIGRFYANDPVSFSNVHNFGRYTYGNNNPYKFTDPDGRLAIPMGAGGCAISGPACPFGAGVGALIGKILTVIGVGAVLNEIADVEIEETPEIDDQKQNEHKEGTKEHKSRVKNAPTPEREPSTWLDSSEADALTEEAWENGTPLKGQPNKKRLEVGRPVGKKADGSLQSGVQVSKGKNGKIHGTPFGKDNSQ